MREPACECKGPGFCPRYQITQGEYAYGLCTGQGTPGRPCDPPKSEMYRRKWRLTLQARTTPQRQRGIESRSGVGKPRVSIRQLAQERKH